MSMYLYVFHTSFLCISLCIVYLMPKHLSLYLSASLASLIRGQVLTTDGTPLVGVNVSFVNYPHYGYTLTRQDGTYV